MKKVLRLFKEPLVLFVVLGILLYLVYSLTTSYAEENNKRISINQAQLAGMIETFAKTWNRPPEKEEIDALLDDLVMDEIFYREALALGLDRTDPTVKRRLRQIMEMMMEDFATVYASEEQLRSYLSENPDKFRAEDHFSFKQLLFPPEEKESATNFLADLRKSEAVLSDYQGGLLLLPDRMDEQSEYEISRTFGNAFTQSLSALKNGSWEGPVASSYGWHLVLIEERSPGQVPDLNEIWDQVEREWSIERKEEVKEEQFRVLRQQYRIILEEE